LNGSHRLSPLERTLIGGRDQQKEAKQSSSIHTSNELYRRYQAENFE